MTTAKFWLKITTIVLAIWLLSSASQAGMPINVKAASQPTQTQSVPESLLFGLLLVSFLPRLQRGKGSNDV